MEKDLFPNKFKNFYGCEMVVLVMDHPPFINVLKNSIQLSGIEGNLITLISKLLNFKIRIVQVPSRGIVFENGTAIGGFKKVTI